MAKAAQNDPVATEPPPLARNPDGEVQTAALADVVQWFLDFDQRVAIMRRADVDELFQWKQTESLEAGVEVAPFDHAEDRFAIGIFQALAENRKPAELHLWISNLLEALNEATQTSQEIATAFKLDPNEESALRKSTRLPTERERKIYLTCCWLEALCTAEARVLGWVYQELYRTPFNPQSPPPVN